MGFSEAVRLFWTKAFDFRTRSRRSEFWWAVLFGSIVAVVLIPLDVAAFGAEFALEWGGVFGWVWSLVILIPSLSLTTRRLHDIGLSGWFQLLYLVPFLGWIAVLVMTVLDSQQGTNKWGDSVKYPAPGTLDSDSGEEG